MRLRPVSSTSLDGPTLIDFESRSRCKLKKRGGRLYWEDPSTEALCAVLYHVESRRWYLWQPGDPTPRLELAVAHNASNFDRFAGKACGWRVRDWADSSSAARRAGLPGALDALGKRWLGRDKDKVGSRFTLALSQPRRAKATRGELPQVTDEARARVIQYCTADVEIMAHAWARLAPWLDVDSETCEVDRIVNDRGICLDKDMCRALQRQIARQQDEAVGAAAKAMRCTEAEARATAMSPAKFTRYTGLENAQAETLKDAVKRAPWDRQGAPGSGELCAARLALASVVPGKLTAALERVSQDGRLRDQLRYYGAHTGRWSSQGMQVHNLPRVGFEDDAKAIGWHANEYVAALCDGALADEQLTKREVSGTLRACLVAAPGKVLTVLDYSGIEARANAWAAGDEDAVDVFRALDAGTGPDPYRVMAARVFGGRPEDVSKEDRGVGKIAELACFDAGTCVLTNRGPVPIVDVRTHDMVWDGVEWVTHAGVVSRGVREVQHLAGVGATRDHVVLSDHWTTWGALAESESALCRALAIGSASLPSRVMSVGCAAEFKPSWCGVAAASESTRRISKTSLQGAQLGVTNAPSKLRARLANIFGGTQRCAQTRTTDTDCCAEYLRRPNGATTQVTPRTQTTARGVFKFIARGVKTVRRFSRICSIYQGGTTHRSTSIELTTTRGTSPETYASSRRARTSVTDRVCASCASASRVWRDVYDIVNAGPRSRFTILTERGPLIVHNCGYGMGGNKFDADNGEALAARNISAHDVVNAWRELHAPIVALWKACERAFRSACEGRTARAGKWKYVGKPSADGKGRVDVWCVLPSGRPIVYANARAKRVTRTTKDGRKFQAWDLTYQGGLWPEHVYGGLLVENAVQALCRDLLADALVRCERAGLSPVGHVHDELIGENDKRAGKEALAEQREIMSDAPEWAEGLPIRLDGFVSERYRK